MAAGYEHERGDLGALLGVLRRRMWLVVLTVIVASAAAFAYSKAQEKKYQSSAQLLFQPLLLDAQLTGLPLQLPNGEQTRAAATDVGLVSLAQVRDLASATLRGEYTPNDLKNAVSVSSQGNSDIVSVTATAKTPLAASLIANAMTTAFIAYRRTQLTGAVTTATNRVRAELKAPGLNAAQSALLKVDLTRLTLLQSVQPDDVQLVGIAQPPTSPSSPKTVLNTVIGALLGLVLGLAIAFGVEALDRRVRRPDELEEALGLPLLATVPASKALGRGTGLASGSSGSEAEAFRFLRENLRNGDGGPGSRCVLITSAAPGSGKTTVALHLAAAAAAGTVGEVLLIEADLRRPRLSKILDLPADRGLSTLLRSSESLEEVVVEVSTNSTHNGVADGSSEPFPGSFDVLGAGRADPNASEFLGSHRMRELLREAAGEYRLTIIDGPPPGFVSDSIPLMTQADGVVVVARVGHESGPELRRLRTELERHGVQPLGVVANFSRRVKNPYISRR